MDLAAKINAALDAGKMIQITTYGRVVRVLAKHRAPWRAKGHEMFKTDATGHCVMIESQKNGTPRYASLMGAKVQSFTI